MNTQETILQLEGLKLKGMAGCYKALQQMPINDRPTLDQFVAQMAEAEQQYRNQRRTELYLKTSKLRYNAVLEDVICSDERNLSKETLLKIMDCSFITRAEHPDRRQNRMREILPGLRHRPSGLLHGV